MDNCLKLLDILFIISETTVLTTLIFFVLSSVKALPVFSCAGLRLSLNMCIIVASLNFSGTSEANFFAIFDITGIIDSIESVLRWLNALNSCS